MVDIPTIQERNVFSEDNLLRSINIVFDADHPERIRHFFPTSKSVDLLKRLMHDDGHSGLFVVAPYGSGKSLLASFFQQIIENKADAISQLSPVFERVREIDFVLGDMIDKRCVDEQMFRPLGIAVPIAGYVKNTPRVVVDGIVSSLERMGRLERADDIRAMASESMDDLIAILALLRDM